ncbi:MAG: helix-turn-helix domain-containing protein [Prevotellaceae bacterium]|jgi:predicted DNA-binding transcriptional regulator AlpA|nr:helix-turn-helix domain-containing protein [Prevotellaceae bacterium]
MRQIQIIATEDAIEDLFTKVIDKILGKREEKELPKYFTVKELADFMGLSIHTIHVKNAKQEIPGSRKVNGRVLFDSKAIIDWIESGEVKTKQERLQALENKFRERRVKR